MDRFSDKVVIIVQTFNIKVTIAILLGEFGWASLKRIFAPLN